MLYANAVMIALLWIATAHDAKTLQLKAEIAQFRGHWHVVELTVDGQKAPPEDDAFLEYVFAGQNVTLKGDELNEEALFQLNLDNAEKAIDLVNAKQPGPVTAGIYRLSGDDLTVCFANEGTARPTDFTNEKGAGRSTFVLRRVSPAKLKVESAKLQGDWKFVTASSGGQEAMAGQLAPASLLIRGDHYELRLEDQLVGEGTFKLDLTGTPRRLRLTARKADQEAGNLHAAYEWDGDQLKLVLGLSEGVKPTSVGPSDDANLGYAVFKKTGSQE